jgi:hypothetical protein
MGRSIILGAHEYDVRPQKIGYLINRLGSRLQEALEAELDGVDGAALIGAKSHDVLTVFIPDLMPVHEFLGYASDEAMRAGDYSEAADVSPEPLQIKDAFKAASDVNGGEVLGHLKALLGPALTQRAVAAITAAVSESARSTISGHSPTSPPPSGASDPTNSGTSAPTSPSSAD